MNKTLWSAFTRLCGLIIFTLFVIPSGAQRLEGEKKPPMYVYTVNWQVPRANRADKEKANSADKAILEKALADGTIVGYGDDENLVRQRDDFTHDNWWAAMSMAGLIKVLDQFHASPNATSPALASATESSDLIFVSRYYNWHPGPYKSAYVHVSSYKMKAGAPDDAIDMLSQTVIVPLLEKLLADSTILEYEIDTLAIHTEAPGSFWVDYIAPKPDGLDKVQAAISDTLKAHPLSGSAFDSVTDSSSHRDELLRGNGSYK
jgi:hypothetical protein